MRQVSIRGRVAIALLTCVMMVGGAVDARADDEKLGGALKPLVPVPRTAAPWPAEIELVSRFDTIVTGRLEISFTAFEAELARVVIDPIAAPPGRQIIRRLMPPITGRPGTRRIEMTVKLIADGTTHDVAGFPPIAAAVDGYQSNVVAVIEPRAMATASPVLAQFAIERWLHSPDMQIQTMSTRRVHLTAADAPTEADGYLAFDVVVLRAESIGKLSASQRAALTSWVRAGGALGVLTADPVETTAAHAEWLSMLAGEPLEGEASVLSFVNGFLDIKVRPSFVGREFGLGRIALFRKDHVLGASRRIPPPVHWLWRARAEVVRTEDGFAPQEAGVESNLLRALVPSTARPVPLGLLVLILVFFVAAIGPGDWWLLGRVGHRWLTWILFPVMCVVFAFVTMWISEAFLGTNDSRRELVIVDLDREGVPVRESRFTVLFLSAERTESIRYDGYHVSELAQGRYAGFMSPMAIHDGAALVYNGRPGGKLEVGRRVYKWSPMLLRAFRFGSDETPPSVDWKNVRPGIVQRAKDGKGWLMVVDDQDRLEGATRLGSIPAVLRSLTFWPAQRMFCEVFQSSPTGGDYLGDLAMADDGRSDRVGVAMFRDGNGGWRVFRQRL